MRLRSGFQKKSIRAIIAGICQKWLYASILDIISLNCAPETLRRLPKVLRRLLWLPALKKCAPETSTVLRRLFPYWNLPLRKPAHNLHGEEQGVGCVCLEDAAVLSHTSFGTYKIFGCQLFFLVLSLPIFSLFTAASNRPCDAHWSRSKLNTTQHQLVFSDRFLGCQLLSGPRNSFPETIKTCILHYIHFATLGHPRFSHLSTICYFSLKLFPKQDQMNIWGKDIQTVNLWLWNDMNSFPAGEYFRQNVSIL